MHLLESLINSLPLNLPVLFPWAQKIAAVAHHNETLAVLNLAVLWEHLVSDRQSLNGPRWTECLFSVWLNCPCPTACVWVSLLTHRYLMKRAEDLIEEVMVFFPLTYRKSTWIITKSDVYNLSRTTAERSTQIK